MERSDLHVFCIVFELKTYDILHSGSISSVQLFMRISVRTSNEFHFLIMEDKANLNFRVVRMFQR